MSYRKLPPNLYSRTYTTAGGYKQTIYFIRFTDWQHVRRYFKAGRDFASACDLLARLMAQNAERHDFDQGAKPGNGFHSWADKFLELKAGKASADKDKRSVERLKVFMGDCPLEEITHSRLLQYRNSRLMASAALVNREMACMRSILLLAKRDNKLEQMPELPFEAEQNERVRIASDAEYKAILAAVDPDIRDVLILLRENGFRLSEVLALRVRDLHLLDKTIDMRHVRQKGGTKRALPQSPAAWKVLERRAKGRAPKDLLFDGVSRYMVNWHFRQACDAHGITGLWVHDLRATFCTEKELLGWPRKVTKEYSGHRSDYAFNRYSRPTLEDLRRYINNQKLSRIDNKPAPTRRLRVVSG